MVVRSAILEVILPSCMLSVTSKRTPFVVESTQIEDDKNSMGFFLVLETKVFMFQSYAVRGNGDTRVGPARCSIK